MCDTNSKQSHKLRSHSMNEALASFLVSRCVKITEKVSFNIASEASYVYILSGQKFIENAKKWSILGVFENLKLSVTQCYQTGHIQKDKNRWKLSK